MKDLHKLPGRAMLHPDRRKTVFERGQEALKKQSPAPRTNHIIEALNRSRK